MELSTVPGRRACALFQHATPEPEGSTDKEVGNGIPFAFVSDPAENGHVIRRSHGSHGAGVGVCGPHRDGRRGFGGPERRASGEGRRAGNAAVIAGRPGYDRSGYFKFHFGEGYRKLLDDAVRGPGARPAHLRRWAHGRAAGRAPCRASAWPSRARTARATRSAPSTRTRRDPSRRVEGVVPGHALPGPDDREPSGRRVHRARAGRGRGRAAHATPRSCSCPTTRPWASSARPSAASRARSTSTRCRRTARYRRASTERSRSSPRRTSGSAGRRARRRVDTRPSSCAIASSTCSSGTGTATTGQWRWMKLPGPRRAGAAARGPRPGLRELLGRRPVAGAHGAEAARGLAGRLLQPRRPARAGRARSTTGCSAGLERPAFIGGGARPAGPADRRRSSKRPCAGMPPEWFAAGRRATSSAT